MLNSKKPKNSQKLKGEPLVDEPLKEFQTAKNVAAASALTALPIVVIQRARDMGCQAFEKNGNINCSALLDFVAENPGITEGLDSSMDPRTQKTWDLYESRMQKRQKRLIAGKQLLAIDRVRSAWAKNVIGCKTKLYTAENTISVEAGMKFGLTPEQINDLRIIAAKHLRLAIREMFQGEFGKVECVNCKKEITE